MQACILYIKQSLSDIYPETEISSLTRIIMKNVTGFPIPAIISDKNKKITPTQQTKIEEIVGRLKQFEPIQYILGETEFFGLRFFVNQNVLIPRPETEELVELIVNENRLHPHPDILDIGTGSGCIAISLKKQITDSNVHAWDVSKGAIDMAKKNAETNAAQIWFEEVNVLANYPQNQKFDIIVSNPPYVLESEKAEMENNILRYEPHLALFVPDNKALMFYERIADVAISLLKDGGRLYFEINADKGDETVKMLQDKNFEDVALFQDISKKDRMVRAVLK